MKTTKKELEVALEMAVKKLDHAIDGSCGDCVRDRVCRNEPTYTRTKAQCLILIKEHFIKQAKRVK